LTNNSSGSSYSFGDLHDMAKQEAERLGKAETFDAKAELQLSVWPFLAELAKALEHAWDWEDEEARAGSSR
jgi:hypothetical protein